MKTDEELQVEAAARTRNTLASARAICADKEKNEIDEFFDRQSKLSVEHAAFLVDARQLAYAIIDICPESLSRSEALQHIRLAVGLVSYSVTLKS